MLKQYVYENKIKPARLDYFWLGGFYNIQFCKALTLACASANAC